MADFRGLMNNVFRKIKSWKHTVPLGLISVLVLGIYVYTAPPGLTWEHFGYDAGDLISCVYTWGIPHPSGTPLYVLVGQLFRHLPFFSNPAARFNFMSSVFGWLSVIFVYLTSFVLTQERFSSIVAAFFFSFTPLIWGQSIIAEVYPLNLFLLTLTTYLLLLWERRNSKNEQGAKFPYGALFVFGLALSNHTSSVAMVLPFIFLVLTVRNNILAYPKEVAKAVVVFLLGLLPYLYLPIRASMKPILNWGNPTTLSNFINHILAKEYGKFFFIAPVLFLDNVTNFLISVWKNFNPLGALFIALGIAFGRKDRFRDFLIFATLFHLIFIFNFNIVNIETYYLPAFSYLAIIMSEGVVVIRDLFQKVEEWIAEKNVRPFARIKAFWRKDVYELDFSTLSCGAFSTLLVVFSLLNIPLEWKSVDLSNEREAYNYGRGVFEVVEPGSLILADGDEFFLGLTYFNYVLYPQKDVAVLHVGLFYDLKWMLEQARRNYPYLKYPVKEGFEDQQRAENALLDFVALNMQERPVYLAVGDKPLKENRSSRTVWGDRFIVQGEGPIYKVIGEKQ